MGKYPVCRVGELPPGSRKIFEAAGRSIGVFNVGGRFYALRNRCPHQGGPLCLGRLSGLVFAGVPGEHGYRDEGFILRCPWHGWEFDIRTGKAVVDPEKTRVRAYRVSVEPPPRAETYPVSVEDQVVYVHI
jgi:nitrite reductase/ring-hydroxylating ferredoxin subunit